jgi:hypothetical protein
MRYIAYVLLAVTMEENRNVIKKKKKSGKKMLREKQENPNQHSVLHADNRNQYKPILILSWLTEIVRYLVH